MASEHDSEVEIIEEENPKEEIGEEDTSQAEDETKEMETDEKVAIEGETSVTDEKPVEDKTPEVDDAPEVKVAESDKSSCTLFVSNLQSGVNSKELEKVFVDVGPVKRCFVVASSDKSKKSFGYVTFAVREDAEKAIENVKSVGSSKVFAKLAKKRRAADEGKADAPASKKRASTSTVQNKSARIIVRNIKFEAKEDEIRKAFITFGDIEDINYPKRKGNNERSKGFCIIQYHKIIDAKNALEQMNGREFLGRSLVVDWSVPENENYMSSRKNKRKTIPVTSTNGKESKVTVKKEEDKKKDEDKDADKEEKKEESGDEPDVSEGRTLFLRRVTLDTTEPDLYEAFCPFGQIKYALLCIDTYTEQQKGTAFVQFVEKEAAESCLKKARETSEDGGIIVNGRRLDVTMVVSPEELAAIRKEEDKVEDKKDTRNLHLAREGQIRPGSKAAEGVSSSDMGKRLELESWKNKMLKSRNMFISDKRLCVRNIPVKMRNKRLREIFESAGGSGAQITEVNVMRDLNKGGSKDDAPTKGFGFVAFSTHKHALAALREVNNNPAYFSKDQRPIVEFSLETRTAVKAEEDHLEKSKDNLAKNEDTHQDNRKRRRNEEDSGPPEKKKQEGESQGQRQGQEQRQGQQRRQGQEERQRRPQRNMPQRSRSGRPSQQQPPRQQMERNRFQGRNGTQIWESRQLQEERQSNLVLDQLRSFLGSTIGPKLQHTDRGQQQVYRRGNYPSYNIWQS